MGLLIPNRSSMSRPGDHSLLITLMLAASLAACSPAFAQRSPISKTEIPFSSPDRAGIVKVELTAGEIIVFGYEGKTVIVGSDEADRSPSGDDKSRLRASSTSPADLKDLLVAEANNIVSLKMRQTGASAKLLIRVPRATSLQLTCAGGGNIQVDSVSGEIEANNRNGSITVQGASGPVLANTLNGRILAQLDRLADAKPVSLSTLNGDIDLTLPDLAKANVKLQTQNGSVHSDFEIRREPDPRPTARNRVVGTINGGGGEIQLETLNGSIHLRRPAPTPPARQNTQDQKTK